MEIDWSKAPEGAEFFADDSFKKLKYKSISSEVMSYSVDGYWFESMLSMESCKTLDDYCERPQQWPETDERINNIGRNRTDDDLGHYSTIAPTEPKTAVEFLNACIAVQSERGKQYDASGTGERSFAAAASAFNAVTGKSLTGSDVCLLLTMVKLVRQYSSPARLHQDSLLDGVSYLSLWAEELTKELGK
jgi:hypothetical protein